MAKCFLLNCWQWNGRFWVTLFWVRTFRTVGDSSTNQGSRIPLAISQPSWSRVGPCYLLAFASRHWYYFACWLKTKSFNFLFDWVRKALQVESFPCNANISRNPINDVSWQFGQFIWDSQTQIRYANMVDNKLLITERSTCTVSTYNLIKPFPSNSIFFSLTVYFWM